MTNGTEVIALKIRPRKLTITLERLVFSCGLSEIYVLIQKPSSGSLMNFDKKYNEIKRKK